MCPFKLSYLFATVYVGYEGRQEQKESQDCAMSEQMHGYPKLGSFSVKLKLTEQQS
jgi:hypothetical protein